MQIPQLRYLPGLRQTGIICTSKITGNLWSAQVQKIPQPPPPTPETFPLPECLLVPFFLSYIYLFVSYFPLIFPLCPRFVCLFLFNLIFLISPSSCFSRFFLFLLLPPFFAPCRYFFFHKIKTLPPSPFSRKFSIQFSKAVAQNAVGCRTRKLWRRWAATCWLWRPSTYSWSPSLTSSPGTRTW